MILTRTPFMVMTFMLFSYLAKAQDKLIRYPSLETQNVKIKKITPFEIIIYNHPTDTGKGLEYVSKEDLKRVVLEDGNIIKLRENYWDEPKNYSQMKRWNLKTEILSPLRKILGLSLEYCTRPGRSLELSGSYIGLGKYTDRSLYNFDYSTGFIGRLGYKFIHQPDYYLSGLRSKHLLKGPYFRPELVFGYSRNDKAAATSTGFGFDAFDRKDVISYGFLVNLGNQWVFEDTWSLDIYFGLGTGNKRVTMYKNGEQWFYPVNNTSVWNTGGFGFNPFFKNSTSFFVWQAGLRLGILLR